MNESLTLAQHITNTQFEDLPDQVVAVTKQSILDAFGVTLAASTLGEGCRAFVDLAIAEGGKRESTILGFGVKTSATMAAFANGSMAHAMDFEDVHDRAPVHPNAATIPAALALAESLGGVSGKELITAVTLGSDLVCRLGLALNVNPLDYGWYIPPILGAFGAATAVGKLLNLNAEQLLDAFSLTLCQATCSGEIIHSPRAVIRSIREAFAAKAGVLSALLARQGVSGFERPFEGEAGLFSLYARGNYAPKLLTHDLGFTFECSNVSFKPWPSCRGTHAYIEAVLQILATAPLKSEEIELIEIVVNPVNKMLCEPSASKLAPVTAIDAKFSLPFAIATAVYYGQVQLEHFLPQALTNPEVLDIARRVTYRVDSETTIKEATRGFLQINTKNGSLARQVDFAYGHPQNPLSQEALILKFKDCAKYAAQKIPERKLDWVVELILNLEQVQDVAEMTAGLQN